MNEDPQPSRRPRNSEEFGASLRALRGRRGLRRLEADQRRQGFDVILSKSQLARYEAGVLPALEHAARLDRLYEGQGWVEVSLRSLWRSRWDPWSSEHGVAAQEHAGSWPAPLDGTVWMKLLPLPENVDETHSIHIEWAPWERDIELSIPGSGAVLTTGKAADRDGYSRTLNLVSDKPLFVLFGAGEVTDEPQVVNVRRGWTIGDHLASKSEREHGPSQDDGN